MAERLLLQVYTRDLLYAMILTLFLCNTDYTMRLPERVLQLRSVTEQEVVDAIEGQTGRKLDKKLVDLPDIRKLGTYETTIKLHPNVTGRFKILVVREKEQR